MEKRASVKDIKRIEQNMPKFDARIAKETEKKVKLLEEADGALKSLNTRRGAISSTERSNVSQPKIVDGETPNQPAIVDESPERVRGSMDVTAEHTAGIEAK